MVYLVRQHYQLKYLVSHCNSFFNYNLLSLYVRKLDCILSAIITRLSLSEERAILLISSI